MTAIHWCPMANNAPRDCGRVAVQVIGRDADGKPIVWRCTFCVERGKRDGHKLSIDNRDITGV